jgi:hypothetical protein
MTPRRAALQSLARSCIVVGLRALDQNRLAPNQYIREGWGRDRTLDTIVRSAANPAMTSQTGWAQELAHVSLAFLEVLRPMSAGADLLQRGLTLTFDGFNTVTLPSITTTTARFVSQGAAIAVPTLPTVPGVTMTSCKLASISEVTREMMESSNAESIITQALIDSAAIGLDAALFSSAAAVADTFPAGILNGLTPITASTDAIPSEAMADDVCNLVGGIKTRAGNGNIIFVAAPEQATRMSLSNLTAPVLMTTARGQRHSGLRRPRRSGQRAGVAGRGRGQGGDNCGGHHFTVRRPDRGSSPLSLADRLHRASGAAPRDLGRSGPGCDRFRDDNQVVIT